jgi:hypothetical protein
MSVTKEHKETFKGEIGISEEGDVTIKEQLGYVQKITKINNTVNSVISPFKNKKVEVSVEIIVKLIE